MSIQSNACQVDLAHQCHLVKELNYATLKEIKKLDQDIKEISKRIGSQKDFVDRVHMDKNGV